MDEVDGGTEDLYREQSEDLALDEEDDLHHNGEHGVGYHDRDGQIYQRSALGRPKIVYLRFRKYQSNSRVFDVS